MTEATGAWTSPTAGPRETYLGAPPAIHTNGVSWGAIIAGAAGAAALSLVLLILGVGLGLPSVSPWANQGVSATTFGVAAILWLTFTQIAASGMGGYLAGRLRTRWAGLHQDEVYFRDTAHGFLAWAVATVVTAATLSSAVGSIIGTGAETAAAVAGGAATTAASAAESAPGMARRAGAAGNGNGYFVDMLFRKDMAASSATSSASNPAASTGAVDNRVPSAEVTRIFANAASTGSLPAQDTRYVGQLVAQQTGMPEADAEKRVSDAYAGLQAKTQAVQADAKVAADKTRKASAYAALWLFVALLAGAFVASLAATYGGRRRDLF